MFDILKILFVILIVIVILLVIWAVHSYNQLVAMNEKINVSWSQIDVVLKQRADLIPGLVETVKGAARFETETLNSVLQSRERYTQASDPKDKMISANQLDQSLHQLFVLSENYPDLKANASFMNFQKEFSVMEDKIAKYRQFYNDMVYAYNRACQAFPKSMIASAFHFDLASYFEISEEEKTKPNSQF